MRPIWIRKPSGRLCHFDPSTNLTIEPVDPELVEVLVMEGGNPRAPRNPNPLPPRPPHPPPPIIPNVPQVEVERTLEEYFSPVIVNPSSCVVLPHTDATHFELKNILPLLPLFCGMLNEDPYSHIKAFVEMCQTFKFRDFDDESVRLRLFSFSLRDRAKEWYEQLTIDSITTWNQMVSKFLNKFFPLTKTKEFRTKLMNFSHGEDEAFHEAWERFLNLKIKCPHHGFQQWQLVQYFYQGMSHGNRTLVHNMCPGDFSKLLPSQAWELFGSVSEHSQQWESPSDIPRKREGRLFEVKKESEMEAMLANLTRKVDAITMGLHVKPVLNVTTDPCSTCGSFEHVAQCCALSYVDESPDQVNALNNPYSQSYNPGWRNHPNFSYANQSNQFQPSQSSQYPSQSSQYPSPSNQFQPSQSRQVQPSQANQFRPSQGQQYRPSQGPPGFTVPSYNQGPSPNQQVPPKPTVEDQMQSFMTMTQTMIQQQAQALQQQSQAIINLNTQMGQLASQLGDREKGKLPSQPIANPRGQYEISTLPTDHATSSLILHHL